jgi:hypothetical protein
MNVASLQQLLGQIGPFARAAGAAEKVASELDRVVQCLEPFKDKSVGEFNELLSRADEYDRTGKLAPPAKAAKAPRTAKAAAISVDEAAARFTALYDRATDPALDYATIDRELDALGSMTAPDLKAVAKKLNVTLPSKATKTGIVGELKRKVKDRKGSFDRNQFRAPEPTPHVGAAIES